MYTTELYFEDYKTDQKFRVHINAYHVLIVEVQKGFSFDKPKMVKEVFARGSDEPKWLDAAHSKVVEAIDNLEKALMAAVKEN